MVCYLYIISVSLSEYHSYVYTEEYEFGPIPDRVMHTFSSVLMEARLRIIKFDASPRLYRQLSFFFKNNYFYLSHEIHDGLKLRIMCDLS